jgi:hypothetical protein
MKYRKRYNIYHYGVAIYVKFVPKSLDKTFTRTTDTSPGVIRIDSNNKGYKMLYNMGWDGFNQLGPRKGIGFKDPIIPKRHVTIGLRPAPR